MKKQDHSFYQNKDCRYFPCHEKANAETFNCLFCYCPLYALGDKCGGNCSYTENGIKRCEKCTVPHGEKGYEYVLSKFSMLAELAKKREDSK